MVRCSAMRRLVRVLLNSAVIISLLLFIAAVALWIRSYTVGEIGQLRGSGVSDGVPTARQIFWCVAGGIVRLQVSENVMEESELKEKWLRPPLLRRQVNPGTDGIRIAQEMMLITRRGLTKFQRSQFGGWLTFSEDVPRNSRAWCADCGWDGSRRC